uniref:tyrosine-protein phosphatase 16-like n=1 Tax=Ciona intestinalis TaxID=7719 RepID=UPI000EF4E6B1
MVWEQECLVIVMLTNTVEAGKALCTKYWPDLGKRCTYDGYCVETVEEVDYGSYIVRTINIEEINNQYTTVLRKLQHFQYTEWSGDDVALFTSSFIQMQRRVNAAWSSLFDGKLFPMVVHG